MNEQREPLQQLATEELSPEELDQVAGGFHGDGQLLPP